MDYISYLSTHTAQTQTDRSTPEFSPPIKHLPALVQSRLQQLQNLTALWSSVPGPGPSQTQTGSLSGLNESLSVNLNLNHVGSHSNTLHLLQPSFGHIWAVVTSEENSEVV